VLFHITTHEQWQHAVAVGEYRAPSLDTEGFIHLSTETQWEGARARFFRDVPDLLLLVIDPERVRGEIRYELVDRENFPHLYGALDIGAVVEVREL
jgi:uncharacterized protein (DUF952 family)